MTLSFGHRNRAIRTPEGETRRYVPWRDSPQPPPGCRGQRGRLALRHSSRLTYCSAVVLVLNRSCTAPRLERVEALEPHLFGGRARRPHPPASAHRLALASFRQDRHPHAGPTLAKTPRWLPTTVTPRWGPPAVKEMTFPPALPPGLLAAAGPKTLEEFVRSRLAQIESQSKSAGPYCSFCAHGLDEVAFLIGGPGVSICEACVQLCRDILRENKPRRRWWWPFS